MRRHRLFIALAVFLVGVSLLPLMGLASEQFEWQRYADAYKPTPTSTSRPSPKPTATSTYTPTPTTTPTTTPSEEHSVYLPIVLCH